MNRLLALLSLLVGCSHANAADSIRLTVEGPMGMVAGDTLAYTISWTAPVVVAGVSSAATSYSLTLSATSSNGAWTVVADSNGAVGKFTTSAGPLPNTANVTSLTLKTWLSAIPWDSAPTPAAKVAAAHGRAESHVFHAGEGTRAGRGRRPPRARDAHPPASDARAAGQAT